MGYLSEYIKYDLWRIMRPLAFHGADKTGPFFEGWYFKLVSESGNNRVSIIPGVYIGMNDADNHAFIQITDGINGKSQYINFPFSDFSFTPGEMMIAIGRNTFTKEKILLDIDKNGQHINGELNFSNLNLWPVRMVSPGVMGPFAWVPGMECYHGIVSMDHQINGFLQVNGRAADFTGGRGYMEKDWGRAMPSDWIWMQCNHFDSPGISLSASIATIPWLGFKFKGFLAGFQFNGQLHRFATYTGAKICNLSVTKDLVSFVLADRKRQLDITAHRIGGNELMAPTTTQMDRRIVETLSAEIDLEFSQKRKSRWRTEFIGNGKFAGLEVVGDLAK